MKFADITVLLGDNEIKLQRFVNDFGRECKKRKLTVNVEKSQVMKVSKNGDDNQLNTSLEVDAYRYLGVDDTNDGKMNEEVNHRIDEAQMFRKGCKSFSRYVSQETQKW